MKLVYLVLGAVALLLLGGPDSVLSSSSGNLHTFVGCAVREFTFMAKKPGCRGLRITTDACWGRCETWEVSMLSPAKTPLKLCGLLSKLMWLRVLIPLQTQIPNDLSPKVEPLLTRGFRLASATARRRQ